VITGILVAWLKPFLSNKIQVVNINGILSGVGYVTSGLPQGSVLDSTLFLLFISDIGAIFSRSLCSSFTRILYTRLVTT